MHQKLVQKEIPREESGYTAEDRTALEKLCKEIKEAQKDPDFRRFIKEFIKATT